MELLIVQTVFMFVLILVMCWRFGISTDFLLVPIRVAFSALRGVLILGFLGFIIVFLLNSKIQPKVQKDISRILSSISNVQQNFPSISDTLKEKVKLPINYPQTGDPCQFDPNPVRCVTDNHPNRQSARNSINNSDLTEAQKRVGNKFFKDSTNKSINFKVTKFSDGSARFEFFSPANNAGYGKQYIQDVSSDGNIIREFKNTINPKGEVIETKWIRGKP